MFFYLDQKDLVCESIQANMLIFVKIDINKNIESLNVSNSAAIVFRHKFFKKI